MADKVFMFAEDSGFKRGDPCFGYCRACGMRCYGRLDSFCVPAGHYAVVTIYDEPHQSCHAYWHSRSAYDGGPLGDRVRTLRTGVWLYCTSSGFDMVTYPCGEGERRTEEIVSMWIGCNPHVKEAFANAIGALDAFVAQCTRDGIHVDREALLATMVSP